MPSENTNPITGERSQRFTTNPPPTTPKPDTPPQARRPMAGSWPTPKPLNHPSPSQAVRELVERGMKNWVEGSILHQLGLAVQAEIDAADAGGEG
jgi:hypothetical protein